jgi:hypothetical protein
MFRIGPGSSCGRGPRQDCSVRAMVIPSRCSSDQRSIAAVRRPETFQMRANARGGFGPFWAVSSSQQDAVLPHSGSAQRADPACETEHQRRGVDAGRVRAAPARLAHGGTRPAAEIDDAVCVCDRGQVAGQTCSRATPDRHRQRGHQLVQTGRRAAQHLLEDRRSGSDMVLPSQQPWTRQLSRGEERHRRCGEGGEASVLVLAVPGLTRAADVQPADDCRHRLGEPDVAVRSGGDARRARV